MQHAINKNTPRGNRISATNVHLKLMIATLSYQTSTNSFVRDSNYRGKRLKIFKRNRPDHLSDMGSMILYRLPPHWYCWLLLCTNGSRMDYWSRRRYRLVWTQCESDATAWHTRCIHGEKGDGWRSTSAVAGHVVGCLKGALIKEKKISTVGKRNFHQWKVYFPPVER